MQNGLIQGIPVVLSGPSGVGKGTVAARVLEKMPGLTRSVSMTTRPPRPGEKDQVDYFFVTKEAFEEAIEKNELVEWAKVYHHYYGTPTFFLKDQFEEGQDVLLVIDVQGAAAIRTLYEDSLLIYMVPPTLEELTKRLFSRAKGEGDDLDYRYGEALREMQFIGMYDYVVVNDNPERAAEDLRMIIQADRLREGRMEPFLRKAGLLGEKRNE